ncbi:uncharacterized protein LOC129956812 [Argiope bruennichi]|uniref:uncharacterized protein LOC129956812 n=1 Tax=Argiope bruennichi TaxID=94029 RepID=UPI0024943185|nr:uncharacterized protein LOC129956812 [Argiope bruennichi]
MGSSKRGPFSGRQKVQISPNFEQHFDRYFVIKRVSDKNESFDTVSPFLVQKSISATVGEVASIKKMKSGDLLIEVSTRKQAQNIQKVKALATIPVTISPHTSLNTSQGVITCGEIFNLPLDYIQEELKPQGVIKVRRITIRREGQILETKHHILTFKSPKLPDFIYAANCRGTVTCARCSEKGHESQQCSAPEKCVNCKSEHTSFSRLCPSWKLEKQITTTKIKEEISYPEGRKKVLAQTPLPGVSYASVVQKSFCENCSCGNCTRKTIQLKSQKSSDSDTEESINNISDSGKPEKKQRKSKSDKSLKLKLAKRGLSKSDLSSKLKKNVSKNSVALGLASQGIAHRDLTSIFGGMQNSPDLKLHPSEDEDEFGMNCDISATQTTANISPSATRIS